MQRVDIKLNYRCNNFCKFCAPGSKRNKIKDMSLREVNFSLKTAYKRGAKEVVFNGGEPTLHPELLKIIESARKLGYEIVHIISNGRIFSYPDFCRNAVAAGANYFTISIHGPDPLINDHLTSVPGSFKQTIKGIANLVSLNQVIATNTLITKTNYRVLPKMSRLLIKLGVPRFQLAFLHIVGTVMKNTDLVVKKTDIIDYVKRAIDIGHRNKRIVTVEAIPYCLMSGYEDCISEANIPTTEVWDSDTMVEDYATCRINECKVKNEKCRDCKYNAICEGPWKEYVNIFGWDEFVPVK